MGRSQEALTWSAPTTREDVRATSKRGDLSDIEGPNGLWIGCGEVGWGWRRKERGGGGGITEKEKKESQEPRSRERW